MSVRDQQFRSRGCRLSYLAQRVNVPEEDRRNQRSASTLALSAKSGNAPKALRSEVARLMGSSRVSQDNQLHCLDSAEGGGQTYLSSPVLDAVLDAELLQEPEDRLGSRLGEEVDDYSRS